MSWYGEARYFGILCPVCKCECTVWFSYPYMDGVTASIFHSVGPSCPGVVPNVAALEKVSRFHTSHRHLPVPDSLLQKVLVKESKAAKAKSES